jgi:formylglycine-generating enzyme required for sulfatase activity
MSAHKTILLAASALLLPLSACHVLAGYEDVVEVNPIGAAGQSGSGEVCEGRSVPEGLNGTAVVPQSLGDGTGCFWIDRTEVTRDQYQRFLDDPTVEAAAESPCHQNATLDPAPAPPNTSAGEECSVLTGEVISTEGDHPIVCVDWCDARAYCRWAGKRLCGDDYVNFDRAAASDWYTACAGGDAGSAYPYGRAHQAQICAGTEHETAGCETGDCTTVSAGSLQSCATEAGVLHLSGNVAEWTDSCQDNTGPGDSCRARGGSFKAESGDATCEATRSYDRDTRRATLGFRCCAYDD